MKNLILTMTLFALANVMSMHADQSINTSQFGQCATTDNNHFFESVFNAKKPNNSDLSKNASSQSIQTNVITYQYTTDGWLQHVAIYSDCIICTNVAGPREGVQFIIMDNGALLDMSHYYTQHKNHFTNKYPWGEVNTYEHYQVVKIK